MKKNFNRNEAQMSFVNIVVICIVLLLYLTLVPSVITPSINSFAALEANDTNPMMPAMVAISNAIPFLMLVAIIVGAFMIAVPRLQQGGGQY
jgi:hypothetical protein